MDTLRLVDVTDEGHLVLMSGDGRRFELPVDAEVRSAVRRDRAAAPPPPRGERPGPREVQARIRAGADAQSVADATGLELTYVQRFEGPALAERRHVADLARLSQVHRDPGARQITLDAAVLAALADSGVDGRALTWDSRRVEGSRWDVLLLVPAAGPEARALEATWRFDVASRSLEEVDEAARRLTRLEQRKLSPVRDRVFDIEAGRAATVKARRAAAAASPQTSSTAALLEALAQQRGRRPQSAVGRTAAPDGSDLGDDIVPGIDPGPDDRGVTPVAIGSAGGRLHRQGSGASVARAPGEHPAGRGRDEVQPSPVGTLRAPVAPVQGRTPGEPGGRAGGHRATDDGDGVAQAEQTRAEQTRAEQTRAEQTRAEQTRAEQTRADQTVADVADRAAIQPDESGSDETGRNEQGRNQAGRTLTVQPPGERNGAGGARGTDPAELSIDPGQLAPLDVGADQAPPGRRPPGARRAPATRSSRSLPRAAVPPPDASSGRVPVATKASTAAAQTGAGRSTERGRPGGAAQLAMDQPGAADTAPARTGRKRRAAVPSWDDIVFGARPDGEE